MRPIEPIDVRDRFAHERRQLLDLLANLTPSDWTTPTACGDWTVKDVVTHLLRGDLGILSRLRDDEPGATIPPDENLLHALNQRNQQWAKATAWLSGRVLRDLLEHVDAPTQAYFESLDLDTLGEVVSWAGPEPAPNWLSIARHYTERWHHQQHIRDAVGQPGLTDRWSCGPVIAAFAQALPLAFREVVPPGDALVELTVTGEAGGHWFVLYQDGVWWLGVDARGVPDASITLDQDTFWRLCTRGISRDTAMARTIVRGNPDLAAPVFDMVSIVA